VTNLINDFGRGIQQNEDQKHYSIGKENAVGISLRTHIEGHEGNPKDKADTDHIPKIVTETSENVLDRQHAGVRDRLFYEAQRRTYEQGVHGAEQEAPGNPEGGGDLLGEHEEKEEANDG